MTAQLEPTPHAAVHPRTRPVDASGKGRVAFLSEADQRRCADPLLCSYNAQDLLVALFRQAVTDAMAAPGDDDENHGDSRWRREARLFIASDWAVELADMGQLPIAEIRRQLGSSVRPVPTYRPSKGLVALRTNGEGCR